MKSPNGIAVKWLLALFAAMLLALGGWGGRTLLNVWARAIVIESANETRDKRLDHLERKIDRIDEKIDRILSRLP